MPVHTKHYRSWRRASEVITRKHPEASGDLDKLYEKLPRVAIDTCATSCLAFENGICTILTKKAPLGGDCEAQFIGRGRRL